MRKSIAELTENIMSIEDFKSAVESLKGFTETDWISFKYYVDTVFSTTNHPFLCSGARALNDPFLDKGMEYICDQHNRRVVVAIEKVRKSEEGA